jgi:hypothetical protein
MKERFPGLLQGWSLDDGNLVEETGVIREVLQVVVEERPSREGRSSCFLLTLTKSTLWWPTYDEGR